VTHNDTLTHHLKNGILGHLKMRRKFRQLMVAASVNSALGKCKDERVN